MHNSEHRIAFGPVPSRRLGRSLGINNVTSKACSYACVYCQVGPTTEKRIEPRRFFSPQQIHEAVAEHMRRLQDGGSPIDYLTIVPDGEPTLDLNLGETIEALRDFGIPIAVITNATLLWREEIRARLCKADLVSVKVDSLDEATWRSINRPHRELQLGQNDGFARTGCARDDLLGITAVHPMRESAVRRLLEQDKADWGLIEALLNEGALKAVEYQGEQFYLRPVRRD